MAPSSICKHCKRLMWLFPVVRPAIDVGSFSPFFVRMSRIRTSRIANSDLSSSRRSENRYRSWSWTQRGLPKNVVDVLRSTVDDERPFSSVNASSSDSFFLDDDQDWLSDAELIRRATQSPGGEALTNRDRNTFNKFISADADSTSGPSPLDGSYGGDFPNSGTDSRDKGGTDKSNGADKGILTSIHKQEKDELIRDFGALKNDGSMDTAQLREEGYFVDSTLIDIARDYSIPICYLGDVLVSWGVPPPIDPHHTPLKDLITGEHAFSLLEALLSLDPTSLNERYSSDTLEDLCYEYDDTFDLSEALNFCIKEGYNLPFGIQTCLKVEQEEELLRVLAPLE